MLFELKDGWTLKRSPQHGGIENKWRKPMRSALHEQRGGSGPKGVVLRSAVGGYLTRLTRSSQETDHPDFSSRTINMAGAFSLLRVRTVRHSGHCAASLH